MEVLPAGAGLVRVRDQYGKPLVLLAVVVGLLLLLACINMASMLLARSAGRQRELAVRVGLGAGRGRLVRQMLTESLLLSAAGALAGVAVAYYGVGVLVRIMASSRAFEHIDIEVHPDLDLVLFTAGIALLTGLLFGLAPAWYAFRAQPAMALRQTGRGGDTWFWRLFGKSLVAAQVALSIFLVTAAAVFLNHLTRLRQFRPGLSQRSRASGDPRSLTQRVQDRATGRAVPGTAVATPDYSAGALGVDQRLHSAAKGAGRAPVS